MKAIEPSQRLVQYKSREEGKDQESMQLCYTHDPGHQMEKWQKHFDWLQECMLN